VLETYEHLVAEGYLIGDARASTRVADVTAQEPPTPPVGHARGARYDLRPRVPALSEFPRLQLDSDVRRSGA